MAIAEGENINNERRKTINEEPGCKTLVELNKLGQESIIKQIDYFYNKGKEFYKNIPSSVFNDIIEYINGQIAPVKKKSKN